MDEQNNNSANAEPVKEEMSASESAAEEAKKEEAKTKDHNKTLMGVLAYLGPLVIIPYLVSREDAFVKFHIKQGLVLLIIELLVWAASSILWVLMPLWAVVNIVVFVLAFIGVVNVIRGKEEEIPLVGHYSAKINL